MARYVEKEPLWLSELDKMEQDKRSSIPQGLDFEHRMVQENNVELSPFERKMQEIGIIPSDAWIAGKSKHWIVNIFSNIGKEIMGVEEETELVDRDYIIDLPMDTFELDKVDSLSPRYEKTSSVSNFKYKSSKEEIKGMCGLGVSDFYGEDITNEDLDVAPNSCEIYR